MIVNSTGAATHYGRVTQPANESGEVDVTIPAGLADGSYTLKVFNEQYNGSANDDTKKTDYASAFDEVALTVGNTPAPIDASVTPTTASYDKYTATSGLTFTLSPGSYSLSAIKNGETALTSGTDYTTDGNSYTITESYLDAQAVGNLTLTFDMDGGTAPTATITISDSRPAPTHTHDWAEGWSKNDTHHWHECEAAGCTITENSTKDGYGAHVYDDDTDIFCNTCDYKRTITPPAHTHSWAAAWTTNVTHHWHERTATGCTVTENSAKDGYGAHVYDDDTDIFCNTRDYKRTITPPSGPTVAPTVEPPDTAPDRTITVVAGDTATLSVTATGTEPLTYQWHKSTDGGHSFLPIGSAPNASYTTSPVKMANNGYRYYCVVTNSAGSARSCNFILNVIEKVDIPATGDNAVPELWLGIMLLAGAGFAANLVIRCKKQNG